MCDDSFSVNPLVFCVLCLLILEKIWMKMHYWKSDILSAELYVKSGISFQQECEILSFDDWRAKRREKFFSRTMLYVMSGDLSEMFP